MRAITWAIRITYANGRSAFLRKGYVPGRGSVPGTGSIVNFHAKATAEEQAAVLRAGLDFEDVVTVIERSHGKRTEGTDK